MISKQKSQKATFNDDSILPLINIIFLLIIFFMVLGRIYPNAVKKADLMKQPAAKNYIKTNTLLILDSKGNFLSDGQKILIKNLTINKNNKISLIINKAVPAKIFTEALMKFKKNGMNNISVVVKKASGR